MPLLWAGSGLVQLAAGSGRVQGSHQGSTHLSAASVASAIAVLPTPLCTPLKTTAAMASLAAPVGALRSSYSEPQAPQAHNNIAAAAGWWTAKHQAQGLGWAQEGTFTARLVLNAFCASIWRSTVCAWAHTAQSQKGVQEFSADAPRAVHPGAIRGITTNIYPRHSLMLIATDARFEEVLWPAQ